jgi:hypothetical protein
MKKTLLAFALAAVSASSAFAQGTIDFINRSIGTIADPQVLYHVPIYAPYFPGGDIAGAGNLPGGFTMGLFLFGSADDAVPLISIPLRTGANAAFFAAPVPPATSTAVIPDVPAGARADLLVRGWQGASFAAAKSGAGVYGEWAFTSLPLGGTPPDGGLPIPTPAMTGWGPENGTGLGMLIPEPSSIALGVLGLGALLLCRRK